MASKIKLKGSLKPKDNLFGGHVAASTEGSKPMAGRADYSERVTLPLSIEQKDLVDTLGKKLQRQRIIREHDFNRNSIIRGLISLLDEGTFDDVHVNSERELETWLKNRFKA